MFALNCEIDDPSAFMVRCGPFNALTEQINKVASEFDEMGFNLPLINRGREPNLYDGAAMSLGDSVTHQRY